MRVLGVCVLGLSLLTSACDEGTRRVQGGAVIDTLDSGMVRVSNAEGGAWGAGEEWRLERDLLIGSAEGDGPEVFGQIVALEVDDEGNIYVVEAGSGEIRVFGPEGEFVRSFGRTGAGPGELRQPAAAQWGPDGNFWVLDFGNRRWSVFSATGEYLRQVERPINHLTQPWPGGFDSSGRILDIVSSTAIGVVDIPTGAIDTFTIPHVRPEVFEVRTANSHTTIGVPFAPRTVWKVDHEGSVWTGDGAAYQLVRIAPAGDTLKVIERAFNRVQVSGSERASVVEQLESWASESGIELDLSRIPNDKPAFQDFYVSDDDHLWVVSEPNLSSDMMTYSSFDVFDPSGVYLGSATSDTPILPYVTPVFRDGNIIAVTVDDLHLMYVVRLRNTNQ